MTMNFDEAVHLASRMKGRFKAFEKLEQVIEAARIADGEIREKTERVAELRSEVEELETRKSDVVAQLKGSEALLKERIEAADATAQQIIQNGEKQLQERLVFLQQQIKNAQEDLEEETQAAERFRADLQSERLKLEEDVKNLRATVESLKDTARKVVGL